MAQMSFQMKESTASRLDRLAERRSLSPEEMATLAIEEFVELEEWRLAEIEAAVREADRGDFASAKEISAVTSKYISK